MCRFCGLVCIMYMLRCYEQMRFIDRRVALPPWENARITLPHQPPPTSQREPVVFRPPSHRLQTKWYRNNVYGTPTAATAVGMTAMLTVVTHGLSSSILSLTLTYEYQHQRCRPSSCATKPQTVVLIRVVPADGQTGYICRTDSRRNVT